MTTQTQTTPLMLLALRGQNQSRPPVWLMRQAGRYLPEYRAIKEKHSFLEMCKTPELALEVTLQPIRRFDMDAAIVFADILLPLESMGLGIDFNPGPKVENPIRARSDVKALKTADPATSLHYVMSTLRQLRQNLGAEKTVIGFAGAPWTMACYATAQGPHKHFQGTQVFAYEQPEAMHELLDKLTETTIGYLLAQLEHGADCVQLFDSWGGNLSLDDFNRFSLPYIQRIFTALKKTGKPSILYVNGSSHLISAMKDSGADALSIDWRTSLARTQAESSSLIIQGNFDPTHLFGAGDEVRSRVEAMLAEVKLPSRYIANLGHGVLQNTPPENVAIFVDTIKRSGVR